MKPDEKFGPAPDRADQMSPFESGYRQGYAEAMADTVQALLIAKPETMKAMGRERTE